eukprot:SAG31_NODE_3671_length_4002_cov_3.065334_4_plen_128_part_00
MLSTKSAPQSFSAQSCLRLLRTIAVDDRNVITGFNNDVLEVNGDDLVVGERVLEINGAAIETRADLLGESAKLLAEATIAAKAELELRVELVLLASEITGGGRSGVGSRKPAKGLAGLRRKVASAVQ